ncbi:hypothetical protein [Thalassoroseus pseudoceratinae]|uniref:hypothetical protein n=1 Tax=Thalassoroseus pseudoceratinae TaxID=2713176 RepID=UPI001423E4AC|nr:hypothetical protein [Thalassoroseus pseudoceratinae]
MSEPDLDQHFVPRPPYQLRTLPLKHRWEATRRHSYYQAFWSIDQNHERQEEELHVAMQGIVFAALAHIGIRGESIDPALDFEQLPGADRLEESWLTGAVHPISVRRIAGLLISSLPESALAELTAIFIMARDTPSRVSETPRVYALNHLSSATAEWLDQLFDEPLVSVNPQATNDQIRQAVNHLASEWRESRNLPRTRVRADVFPAYFTAWDLREGWHEGRYDIDRERTLQEVARELNESVSTVQNHYAAAFQLITGHQYSPELWWKIFGAYKLSLLGVGRSNARSLQRPRVSRSEREVPETQLGASVEHLAAPLAALKVFTHYQIEDLRMDVTNLQSEGSSIEEIAQRLCEGPTEIEAWQQAIRYLLEHELS